MGRFAEYLVEFSAYLRRFVFELEQLENERIERKYEIIRKAEELQLEIERSNLGVDEEVLEGKERENLINRADNILDL